MPWKDQFAADDLSRTGLYQDMLRLADVQFQGTGKRPSLSPQDSIYVHSFRPVPARQYLLDRATKEQVIIFNEAHHQPLHRSFVTSLLKGLYAKGFRYLGIETLGYVDSLLNQRKYPLQETGYYSKEPQYGNLIREALRVGFTLFPYETTKNHNNKEREIDQAQNIVAYMKSHPGKYLLHVGYSHVIEGPVVGWEKAMAGRLKEYTGINPLTINQETLTEHSNPAFEAADYRHISYDQPAVLINQDGLVYNGVARDSSYDIRLYHPRTIIKDGRPDWVSLQGVRKPYFLKPRKIKIGYPVMVLGYVSEEDITKAVPYDIVELETRADRKTLFLEKGNYTLVVRNRQGKSQELKIRIG